MKKFIKLFSGVLACTLALSLCIQVFAAEPRTHGDTNTVTITKEYRVANKGTTSPAEEFKFTIQNTSVTDAAEGVTKDNMPTPKIGTVSYGKGDAGTDRQSKKITVTLPRYDSVGIYIYTIKETAGTTAGVTYYGKDIILKITVIEQNGKACVAAVHTETEENAKKSDTFANTYSAGSLAVKKIVSGNLGDRSKKFNVTVNFKVPEGKIVKEDITYTVGNETKTIAKNKWENGMASAQIQLKHNDTVTFTNIPYGVTYTAVEDDYTGDKGGYAPANYTWTDNNYLIDTASDQVTITNTKDVAVDTGIDLDSLPYILALTGVIAGAGVAFVIKMRKMNGRIR